jgi:hypothetical protein
VYLMLFNATARVQPCWTTRSIHWKQITVSVTIIETALPRTEHRCQRKGAASHQAEAGAKRRGLALTQLSRATTPTLSVVFRPLAYVPCKSETSPNVGNGWKGDVRR